tara:strand:- start:19 stop:189 length:171 start_codon:yes stop_codon:yes gene_type:complete
MKVGDLVKLKNMPSSDYGIIIEINGKFEWAEVYWIAIEDKWAFFTEDLEIIDEEGH